MDSAEPLSSILWTLTPHPGGIAAAGYWAAAGLGQYCLLNSGAGRSSPVRNLVQLAVFGPGSHAFQKISLGFGRSFFIIGGMDCSFLRLRGILLWSFVGFALTAVGSIVLADTVMEYQNIRSLNRTNAFFQYGSAQPIW